MNQILNALYDILCFVTEDATANKYINLPPALQSILNQATIELGEYLDTIE